MKFSPKPVLRISGFAFIATFILLPFYLSFADIVIPEERHMYMLFCWVLALIGAIILHLWFWEKFFAVLILSENEIRLECPLRKTKIISVTNCLEIGAYIENKNNGIPVELVYFSEEVNPQQYIQKNGVIKPTRPIIKFWYTDTLCDYIIHTYPADKTAILISYQVNRPKW